MAGIYIHIPFCRKACSYCNFHFSTDLKQIDDFLFSLKKEIGMKSDFISDKVTIETIYFGGGTPGLLATKEISSVLEIIEKKFNISSNAEITIEANPDDIDYLKVKEWMRLGINRISLGIQSFSDKELQWMNRNHSSGQSILSINQIIDAGISNFSVDLIFGSQLQSKNELIQNIEIITEKKIPHISCYALTAEPKTLLHHLIKTKKAEEIQSEKQAAQFLLIMDLLNEYGYEQYEISNYSLPGKRSRHNSSYWAGKPYFGFGPSAHSFDGINKRRWNVSNNALYVKSIMADSIPFEEELLTPTQQLNEYIMTSIRTIEGIQINEITSRFGLEISQKLLEACTTEINSGRIIVTEKNIFLSKEGKLFADGIAADLFFDQHT